MGKPTRQMAINTLFNDQYGDNTLYKISAFDKPAKLLLQYLPKGNAHLGSKL